LFEALGPSQTLYEDRIAFAVTRRRAPNRLAAAVLRPLLRIAFAHRHRVVRTAVGNTHQRVAPRWAAVVALAAATTPLAAAPAPTEPLARAVPSFLSAVTEQRILHALARPHPLPTRHANRHR
jgi:hypothetical protein